MTLLAVNSEAGLREVEFYGDFIELCPQGRVAVCGGKMAFGGGVEEGTNIYGVLTVYQAIHPLGN